MNPPDEHSGAGKPRWAVRWFVSVLLAQLVATGCAGVVTTPIRFERTDPLRSPFRVEERRALFGQPITDFHCPPPVAAVRDLWITAFYSDRARWESDTRLLRAYEDSITRTSDDFVRSSPPSPAAADCTLDWLDAWARKDALLGRENQQGRYERQWSLSSIASAYLKVRGAQGLDAEKRDRVADWIQRGAGAMLPYYWTATAMDTLNNHRYWAGLAAALSGIARDDKRLFNWGIEAYWIGIRQIQKDGILPLELERGSRALHYHKFALMPLILLAEVGAENGLDLYGMQDGAIHRLATRVAEGLEDSTYFDRLTGRTQQRVAVRDLAWMEPYFARFRDARLVKWLRYSRPMKYNWFGGDATLHFGVRDL